MEVVAITTGYLRVHAVNEQGEAMQGVLVQVYQDTMLEENCIYSAYTNRNGSCIDMELSAPGIAYSYVQNGQRRPYALYHVEVIKDGYDMEEIRNVQVFPEEGSTLYVQLHPSQENFQKRNILSLGDHKLYEGEVNSDA